jgi:nucleotide-binding universal stress UspA family protein
MPGIVVGVDGSPNSELALAWAMNEAAIRQAPLTVMVVHQAVVSWTTGHPVSYPGEAPETQHAEQAVEAMVEKAASQMAAARPASVTVRAVNGFPAEQLIEASHDADMVVVGSRGREGFARLLLGSVSTQVVHHASCPVVVVPQAERESHP